MMWHASDELSIIYYALAIARNGLHLIIIITIFKILLRLLFLCLYF